MQGCDSALANSKEKLPHDASGRALGELDHESSFDLQLRSLSGEVLMIAHAKPTWMVSDLKGAVATTLGLMPSQQTVAIANIQLSDDSTTLEAIGAIDVEFINLIISPLRIIVLGDSATGKTTMANSLFENFSLISPSSGEIHQHVWEHESKKVEIWDCPGQERFRESVWESLKLTLHAVVLCFDVTRKPSYTSLKQWLKNLQAYQPQAVIAIAALKCDLEPSMIQKEFLLAKQSHFPKEFFISTYKNGDPPSGCTSVRDLFVLLANTTHTMS